MERTFYTTQADTLINLGDTLTLRAGLNDTTYFFVSCEGVNNCRSGIEIPPCGVGCDLVYSGYDVLRPEDCFDVGGLALEIAGDANYLVHLFAEGQATPVITTSSDTVRNIPSGNYRLEIECSATGNLIVVEDIIIPAANYGRVSFGSSFPFECAQELRARPFADSLSYQWSNGEVGHTITVFEPNTYIVTITTPSGCSGTDSVTVNSFSGGPQIPFSFDLFYTASCGASNGFISTFVTDGVPPYTYAWSNDSTGSELMNVPPGDYSVTVTDAFNCQATSSYTVSERPMDVEFNAVQAICNDETLLTVTPFPEEPTSQYTYQWSDAAGNLLGTERSQSVTEAGLYHVDIVNVEAGCERQVSIEVINENLEPVEHEIRLREATSSQGTCIQWLEHNIDGRRTESSWDLPSGETVISNSISGDQLIPGFYQVTNIDPSRCEPIIDSLWLTEEDLDCTSVRGQVFLDQNEDCTFQEGESPIAFLPLVLDNQNTGDRFYAIADANGSWSTALPSGAYLLSQGEDHFGLQLCSPIAFIVPDDGSFAVADVPLVGLADCPRLGVNVSIPELRRCLDNSVIVNFINTGNQVASDATLSVRIEAFFDEVIYASGQEPDSETTDPLTGALIATWQLGEVPSLSFGSRTLTVRSCNVSYPIGSAACITASVTPASACPPDNVNWNGASLRVSGRCDDNENVIFTLENVGAAAMEAPLSYIVIEDGVVLTPEPVNEPPLGSGEVKEIPLPANGSTYHLQAEQVANHPGLEMPIDFVEGCGSGATFGIALQFPLGDDAPWIDEECVELTGPFDPNDKRAMPRGRGPDRLVNAGELIDYTLRFQNTGTDTAYLVLIRDTLATVFDPATFRLNGATHPVDVQIDSSGRELAFVFENIRLVDSFTNAPASNGSVSFSVRTWDDLPAGTSVDNDASIYFDFNAPIVTNLAQLEIGELSFPLGTADVAIEEVAHLTASPNPAKDLIVVDLSTGNFEGPLVLEVIDVLGQTLLKTPIASNIDRLPLNVSNLASGAYLLRLQQVNGRVVGAGRIVIQ